MNNPLEMLLADLKHQRFLEAEAREQGQKIQDQIVALLVRDGTIGDKNHACNGQRFTVTVGERWAHKMPECIAFANEKTDRSEVRFI